MSPINRLFLTAILFALVSAIPAQAQLFKKRQQNPVPSPPPMHQVAAMNPYANPGVALSAQPIDLSMTQASPLPETVVYRQPIYSPPSYDLPCQDYRYKRSESRSKGGFFSSGKPSEEMIQLLNVIRERAEAIAKFDLPYVFGGDHPSEGGLDCSGTMQFLLSDIGFKDMPRTSYDQYSWLRKARTLKHSKSIPDQMGGRKGIKPGDLIFWGGTYDSGHKVSHVMIYLGQGRDGTHYMFGARGKKKEGLNGAGVDIFKLESGYQKSLIGFGSLPGVS